MRNIILQLLWFMKLNLQQFMGNSIYLLLLVEVEIVSKM